ncbi:MAG TPA: alanine racemase [Fimbriimonadaceae bacterium]|jgi:alanine racemase
MRAWLEIDLGVIGQNVDVIKSYIGKTGIIAVVKSDAYGHGIEQTAKLLEKKGVLAFAVISLEEAVRVRRVSNIPVLIMGYLDDQEIEQAIACGFVLSLFDKDLAHLYEAAAHKLGRTAMVHLKVETGLNRLGLQADEAEFILMNQGKFPHLRIESVYSHLSTSSVREDNLGQLARFQKLLAKFHAAGEKLPLHMANSHALGNFQEGFFSATRLGLALYGVDEVIPGLQPSLECKAVIIQRKTVKKGEGISYNKLFRAPKNMEVGVIGIGYGEGLSQALTGKANVLVNGKKTPILGQICMNLSVIDLTGIQGERGTVVTVVGKQDDETISVIDLAKAAGIRHHEILCRFGLALPRTYINDPFAVTDQTVRNILLEPVEAVVGAST